MRRRLLYAVLGVLAVLGVFVIPDVALAQDEISPADLKLILDNVWILIAAFLVFLMQAGFAMVESGFTRQKNAANIMMKNLMDFSMATIAYWAIGFALMFGAGNALVGTAGWFIGDPSALGYDTQGTMSAGWLFQVVFAGTAATIISGAMAERTKFKAYLIYSGLISGIIYPISGHWVWGGGWLSERGFMDFAGSTVVHSVGAWAALVGAILVGPRLGKFGKDGRPRPIFGHSMPLGILGVFILWFGWFGFNPGSQLAADIRGVAGAAVGIAHIAVTTNLSAAFGAVTAMFTIWVVGRKPDVGMAGNGALAGLVGITAGCAWVEPWAAALIGTACGFIVVISVMFFDRIRVDDPVGAISVHGVCGVFGTLAVGLFAAPHLSGGVEGLFYGGGVGQLATQVLGVVAIFGWVIVTSLIVFGGIKYTVGLRVDEEEELEGLDIGEHGMWGYPEAFLGPSGQASPEALAQAREGLRTQGSSRRSNAGSRS